MDKTTIQLISRMLCPTIKSVPAMKPRRAHSLIVAASNGPGIIASERAMTEVTAQRIKLA